MLLLVLFAAGVGLVRMQPQSANPALARVLLADCPAPCWEGIRPGVTSKDEALPRLRAHPWVAQIIPDLYADYGEGWMHWRWSPDKPAFIPEENSNSLWVDNRNMVKNIEIRTTVPLGVMLLFLGDPDWSNVYPLGDTLIQVNSAYVSRSFFILFQVSCTASIMEFWQTPVSIYWVDGINGVGKIPGLMPGQVMTCDA